MKVWIKYSDGRYTVTKVDDSISGENIVDMSANVFDGYDRHLRLDHKWQRMLGCLRGDFT